MNLTEAEVLAYTLLERFDLHETWSFKFDNATRRFGCCKPHKRLITISRSLTELNAKREVEDVIRHEIAHALDYMNRGTSDHSEQWKYWARRAGARPRRCYDGNSVKQTKPKLYDYCVASGCKHPRYRKANAKHLQSCAICGGSSFELNRVLVPNIEVEEMKAIEQGTLEWYTLPQAQKIAAKVARRVGPAVQVLPIGKAYKTQH